MWMKGIVLGLMLYAAFVLIIVTATVRGIARPAGPNSGVVGVDLVTLYHNTFENNVWLIVALVGSILVGVSLVAAWPRFTPVS
jgi:hypothetical protein